MRPMATRAVEKLRRMRSYKQDWEPKDSVVEGKGYDQDQTSLAEMPDELWYNWQSRDSDGKDFFSYRQREPLSLRMF